MTCAGLKKCRPTTSCGRVVTAPISSMSSVEVLVPRMAPGLRDLVERAEDVLLQRHVLEHRLDDEIGVAELGGSSVGVINAMRWSRLLGLEAAAADGALVVLAHAAQNRVSSILLLHVEHGDRHADIGEAHGDAAAHGARADDADPGDRARFHARGECREFCAPRARQRTNAAARANSVARSSLADSPPFDLQAFVERQIGRPPCSASSRASGDCRLRMVLATCLRLLLEEAVGVLRRLSTGCSRVRRGPASFGHQLRARTRRRPGSRRLRRLRQPGPMSYAAWAATGLPERIMSSACPKESTRGSRWVPPAPGMMPRESSGRPKRAFLSATR